MKNRIFALLLALCLLLTAAATAEETRKIVVTGTATVSVEADRAILSLGVRSTADDAARASAENATAVDALKTAEPWLFANERTTKPQGGKTGLPNAGTSSDEGKTMKRWRRLAGLDDSNDNA